MTDTSDKETDMPDFNEIMELLDKATEEAKHLRTENSELREYLQASFEKWMRTCVLNFLLTVAFWTLMALYCTK